jgi:hypothetical protein
MAEILIPPNLPTIKNEFVVDAIPELAGRVSGRNEAFCRRAALKPSLDGLAPILLKFPSSDHRRGEALVQRSGQTFFDG